MNHDTQVSLATDFMYNYFSRDVTASVGYDYMLRQVSNIAIFSLDCKWIENKQQKNILNPYYSNNMGFVSGSCAG
jgi:hypothetical protein